MTGLGSSLVGLRLPQSMASLGGAPVQGGGVVEPFPPPSGYQWVLVTETSQSVTENGETVVELERIAA